MDTTRPITRIDLERLGANLIEVRQWYAGWRDDGSTPADIDEVVEGQTIPGLLAEYEKQGFTVWMFNNSSARALRGAITRIDFINGKIRKYCFGWLASTPPISEKPATPDETAVAIQWCKEHGWTVYEWPGGARAWKGEPKPIHDDKTIRRIRRLVDATPGDPRRHYDLAFYF